VTDRRGECDDPAAASGLLHTLRAALVQDPQEYEPHDEASRIPKDLIRFDVIRDQLRVRAARLEAHLLDGLSRGIHFEDVMAGLRALPESDWIWIDPYAGIRIPRDSAAAIGEVYLGSIKRFERWLI
jgi:hypothetical protein